IGFLHRRPAGTRVKTDDPERLRLALACGFDPKIADQMAGGAHAAHGAHAASSAPSIKLLDLLAAAKFIVTDAEHAVGRVEGMGVSAVVAIDLVPIAHLEAVKRMPKDEFIGSGGHSGQA